MLFRSNSAGKYTLTAVEDKYNQGAAVRTDDNFITSVSTSKYVIKGNTVVSGNLNNGETVYADNATVFVVRESDGTVTTYTGIKNVPDVKTGATNAASVTYLRKANGLLGFMFIDVANDAVIEGSESSDLLYVVKYDGQTWIDDMNTYYTYKVLDANGEETSIKADSRTIFSEDAKGNVYGLYKNPRTNSDGYVTSSPAVTTGSDFIAGSLNGHPTAGTDKWAAIYSNDTIWLYDNATSAYKRFVLADDAKIVLVSRASALNRDPGASYEAEIVSGKTLAASLSGYTVTGTYAGQLKSSTSNVLTTLYVTVTTAS